MPDTTKRPDRAEISKRVERAEKFLQRGKTADALDEFLAVLAEDPENDSVRQMAADLCVSLSRTSDAVRLLGELFERQLTAGDSSRATLTYKRLARLVNPTWEQKFRFAQLIQQSNKKLALETYETALTETSKLARKPESVSILKRIVELDSTDKNFLRLGELCSQVNDNKGAAAAFCRIAEIRESEGADPSEWYERAYTEDSTDPKIVLAYSKGLLSQGQIGAVIFVLEQHVLAGAATQEMRDVYAQALLGANRLLDAEPIIWELFEQHPTRIQQILDLIGALIDSQLDGDAVALSRKLEQFQRRRGERKTFVSQMQEISAKHRASTQVLEFLSELFNSSNKESEYAQTLVKLFDLYFSLSNFEKAGECLDRAAEVDPYESGHQKRLESLKGKIDDNRYQVIASRFNSATKGEETRSRAEEVTLGTAALQDLMLQAEILVQYGMKSKAVERLLRIQELFPHEEERNEDLQRLYMAAGVTPKYSGAAPVVPAPTTSVPAPALPAQPAPASYPTETSDVSSLTKVADITRKLYKQSTANNVLATAVNEIGSHWRLTRCVAAMRKPGLPPTAVQEFTADGVRPAEPSLMVRLVSVLHELTVTRGPLAIPDTLTAPELQPVREIITELALTSLLALPLGDGQEQVGILLLMQTTARGWNASDVVVLKTIGEQITVALNNVGLRRLVKNLSVTDEGSGLLNRASYLDLLQAEIRRALQQATPVSVLLMKFSRTAMKEGGDNAVESTMQQIGRMISANIRQNDLAFRYDKATIALVLGETSEKEALMALEKLKKLVGEIKSPGKDQSIPFAAGLGQAVTRQQYDPVDIVTEIINRAEQALDTAISGPTKVVALAANAASAAVA